MSNLQIKSMIVPTNKYGLKCPYTMTPKYVVIHNSANDASAINEVKYMITNNREVSFHYAVDDIQVVQGLPLNRNGWHAGDGSKGNGNRYGIAIEICYSKSGGVKFANAEKNAAILAAKLLKTYGWDISHLKKHQDFSGKYCPHRTLDMGWKRFKNMVQAELDKLNGSNYKPSTTSSKKVNATYRVRTQKHGWLSPVTNLEDYAGYQNSPITGIAIKVDKGSIKYRVHVKGGKWLGWITGYSTTNINKYAGNGKIIDAIQVYYYTPNDIRPYKRAHYKTDYGWQYDTETKNKQDGYAGVFGHIVTRFEMEII